jgi:hypothetical protein
VSFEFSPFAAGSALGFLTHIKSKGVRQAVPKMDIAVKRLRVPRGSAEPPTPQMSMTFVDGKKLDLDMRAYAVKQIYAEIERQTGRLELEAMRRGQPWIQ